MNTETQREILSLKQRQRLQADKVLCERELFGRMGIPAGRGKDSHVQSIPERLRMRLESNIQTLAPDPAAGQRLRNINRALAEGSPRPLSDSERIELEKVRREFEEWAPKNMIPKRINNLRSKEDGFSKAVDAAMHEHSTEFTAKAEKYRNAMRQLEPDNPDAGNIEGLRPN